MRQTWAVGRWRSVLTTACAVAVLLVRLAAQEAPAPRVSLGFAAGPPGKQVTVPILLDGAAGKIAGLVSQVSFPATSLTFIRLERAALLEATAFDALAEVRDATADAPPASVQRGKIQPQERTQIVEIRISSKKRGTTLRDGILGYLVFQIQPGISAEKTPEILLTHDARILLDSDDTAPARRVASEGAKLVVEKPGLPVISCFFYMH